MVPVWIMVSFRDQLRNFGSTVLFEHSKLPQWETNMVRNTEHINFECDGTESHKTN